jgi:hypothetical protein
VVCPSSRSMQFTRLKRENTPTLNTDERRGYPLYSLMPSPKVLFKKKESAKGHSVSVELGRLRSSCCQPYERSIHPKQIKKCKVCEVEGVVPSAIASVVSRQSSSSLNRNRPAVELPAVDCEPQALSRSVISDVDDKFIVIPESSVQVVVADQIGLFPASFISVR